MDTDKRQRRAYQALQELGLQEYEAKCFVGLTRLAEGTAKEVSAVADVPRTRVYDAMQVLETQGLVEIQHTSPQRYRSVSVDEAIDVLRRQYESEVETLRESLENVERVGKERAEAPQEVWSLGGVEAVTSRTEGLLAAAEEEAVLVLGEARLLTEDLIDALEAAVERGLSVSVGAATADLEDRLRGRLSESEVCPVGLGWLCGGDDPTGIGRLLLVDGETLLASTYDPATGEERAVMSRGHQNAFVVVVRRLVQNGLVPGAVAERE